MHCLFANIFVSILSSISSPSSSPSTSTETTASSTTTTATSTCGTNTRGFGAVSFKRDARGRKTTIKYHNGFVGFHADLSAWPNGLASRRQSMQVQLAFRLVTHLCRLALTLVELKFACKSTKVFSPFGHPTQVDTSWSQVNCTCLKFTTFCDLRELVSRLTNPLGRPS